MQMSRPQAYAGYRVMIVDDEPSVLAMARSVLLSVGFPVISASSGEMAVAIYNEEFFAKREISLVILDLTLPGGITGLEAFDLLRQINSEVRVIVSSGYFDEAAATAARKKGFAGILPKPYTADKLIKLVQWGVARAA